MANLGFIALAGRVILVDGKPKEDCFEVDIEEGWAKCRQRDDKGDLKTDSKGDAVVIRWWGKIEVK
jgi:hypothetical protein